MNRFQSIILSIILLIIYILICYYMIKLKLLSAVVLSFLLVIIILNILYPVSNVSREAPDFYLLLYFSFQIVGILLIFFYVMITTIKDSRENKV